jgi:hypothetical protein
MVRKVVADRGRLDSAGQSQMALERLQHGFEKEVGNDNAMV